MKLDVAVPVLVRGPDGLQRGMARNISEGGMLIEMSELPAIGSRLEITFSGISGSVAVTLFGDVRHQLAWQHAVQGKMQTMRGVGLRFVDEVRMNERLASAGDMLH